VAGALFLASVVALMSATAAGADAPPGTSTTTTTTTSPPGSTTTTLPAPHLVQTSLTFSQNGSQFSDVAQVDIPAQPLPEFFLRLSPDTPAVMCTATPETASQSSDGGVSSFGLVCDATELPSLFAPTLEVLEPAAAPAFLPVTLVNNTDAWAVDWLPFVVGGVLALLTLLCVRAKSGGVRLGDNVAVDVAWSASDSWVTNLGAVVALLTAVVGAASTSLANVLPGLPSARVEVLSVIFASLLAMAPLLYGMLTKQPPRSAAAAAAKTTLTATLTVVDPDGTRTTESIDGALNGAKATAAKRQGSVGGVLLASVATLVAVFGELTTLALLVDLSTAHASIRSVLYVGVGVFVAVIVVYAVQAISLMIDQRNKTGRHSSPLTSSGIVSGTL
jgi:hypothetical protein